MPTDKPVKRYNLIHQWMSYAINLPRYIKISVLIAVDFIVSVSLLLLALAVRYGDFGEHVDSITVLFLASIPIIALYFRHFYTHVLRVFHDESMHSALYILLGYVIICEFSIYTNILPTLPRAAPGIYAFLFYVWLWNSRIITQVVLRRIMNKGQSLDIKKQNVLLYNSGNSARDLILMLRQSDQYQIVGLVDERTQLHGGMVLGVKVYSNSDITSIITKLNIQHVFLALPSSLKSRQLQLIRELNNLPVQISRIPNLEDIASGKIKLSDIQPVNVLDVLQRDTVTPNAELLQKNITQKVVMVTGAGGSIGSELCRQIIQHKPQTLVLFELSEFALYSIQQELTQLIKTEFPNIELHAHLGSVTNQRLLEKICKLYQIQTIYHAAAYKHVPIVEANEYEGVMNNFVGTYNTLQAAINTGVATFVSISTDKAVRPTNVMGATKRMAEFACQALANHQSQTIISMVRFGNVLGSSGSVVPLFNKQIAKGGPLTVTHPDVTRYFMTIPEAAQLVIQAGAMAKGGEVFVLDMGDSVKIVELAKRMIRLSGNTVKGEGSNINEGIGIEFVGLRPGEKLYEELIIGGDNISKTQHELIMQAREDYFEKEEIEQFLTEVINEYETIQDTVWLKARFENFVEGYKSSPRQAI